MTTQAVLTYAVAIVGLQSAASVATQMGNPPAPFGYFISLGVLPISDVSAAGGIGAQRIITLGLVPTVAPTATCVIDANGTLISLAITARGQGLALPPIVRFTDPVANPAEPDTPATVKATIRIKSATLLTAGANYTAPTVKAVGGLYVTKGNPNGTPPTFTVALVGAPPSAIASITATGHGEFVAMPYLLITDTTGTGATAQAVMELDNLYIVDGGKYPPSAAVTVNLIGPYKYNFPDTLTAAQQGAPFSHLLTAPIQQATSGIVPVSSVVVT